MPELIERKKSQRGRNTLTITRKTRFHKFKLSTEIFYLVYFLY